MTTPFLRPEPLVGVRARSVDRSVPPEVCAQALIRNTQAHARGMAARHQGIDPRLAHKQLRRSQSLTSPIASRRRKHGGFQT